MIQYKLEISALHYVGNTLDFHGIPDKYLLRGSVSLCFARALDCSTLSRGAGVNATLTCQAQRARGRRNSDIPNTCLARPICPCRSSDCLPRRCCGHFFWYASAKSAYTHSSRHNLTFYNVSNVSNTIHCRYNPWIRSLVSSVTG